MGRPVMIEAAINGNALRELNPNIPYSPEEIAGDAIATCRAGAALIHFHVRDPQTGRWVQDVPYYSEVYRRTRAVCVPLLWPTFPFDGTPAERFSHFVELAKDPATKPDPRCRRHGFGKPRNLQSRGQENSRRELRLSEQL